MTAVDVPLHESPIDIFLTKENLSIDVDQVRIQKANFHGASLAPYKHRRLYCLA